MQKTNKVGLSDKSLVRELILIVIIKIIIIFALWWTFVREERVSVNSDSMANMISPTNQNTNNLNPLNEKGETQ